MPLVIALRNETDLVVASDTTDSSYIPGPTQFGPLLTLPNRVCILMAGNLDAVHHAIMDVALPRASGDIGAAGVAQVVSAALLLEVVPKLSAMTGRAEIIVAGIDPIRHTEEPGLYHLDSARNFELEIINGPGVAAGATAALANLFTKLPHQPATEQLVDAAKEAYATTKMRWPDAVWPHLIIGTISGATKFDVY